MCFTILIKITIRAQNLAAYNAIAQQSLDNQLATEQENEAAVRENQSKVQLATADLQDTLITAPFDGRIDLNDLSLGNFVEAGSTVLATISSFDPIFVQYSMNENEYLKFNQSLMYEAQANWARDLKLTLSYGSEYPLLGQVAEVDRGLDVNTGSIIIKAIFNNPEKKLVPGMFARVLAQGEVRKGALLIPERSVQRILGRAFVYVLGENDRAEKRAIRVGSRVGNLYIVEEGLSEIDRIIVDGSLKIKEGTPVKLNIIGLADL